MAKRKGTRRGGTANRRPRRRVVGMLSQGTINALMTGTLVAVPAIGGLWAVNQILRRSEMQI